MRPWFVILKDIMPKYFVVMLTLILFTSCAKAPPKAAISPVGERTAAAAAQEEGLKKFADATRTVRGLAWVELQDGEEVRETEAAIVISRSAGIRADAIDQLADVWAMTGTDGQKLWLYLPSRQKLYSGKASRANLFRLAKFDLEIPELISILAGAPFAPENSAVMEMAPGGGVFFFSGGSSVRFRADKKSGLPFRIERSDSDGKVDYEATFEDYKKIGPIKFPHRIEAIFPERGAKIVVTYRDVTLNDAVDSKIFSEPRTFGAKKINIKDR